MVRLNLIIFYIKKNYCIFLEKQKSGMGYVYIYIYEEGVGKEGAL